MNNKNFYRTFMSKRSHLINLNISNFFNEDERLFLWTQPRTPQVDFLGREPTIFKLNSQRVHNFLENKLRRPHLKYHNFIIDNICLLKLNKPTKPHIDGHYPIAERYGKKYCVTKTVITPIAFDTELENPESLTTSVITFKQHYNYYVDGGLEFDRLFAQKNFYGDYNFEDSKNNLLDKHNNPFIPDDRDDEFSHITHQFDGALKYGIDIEEEIDMKLGDIFAFNPYQLHCTKNYTKDFSSKWVLRFLICELIR